MTAEEYREALVTLGWRQADLCRRVEVSKNTASRWAQEGPPRWVSEYLGVMVALDTLHARYVRPPRAAQVAIVAQDGIVRYPACMTPDDGGYVVTFRDVPEAITQGDTMGEALEMAADALVTAMSMYVEAGKPLPKPSKPQRGEMLVDFRLASTATVGDDA